MKTPKIELSEEIIDSFLEDNELSDSDEKQKILDANMECFSDPSFSDDRKRCKVDDGSVCSLWDYCVASYGVRHGVGVRENEELLEGIKRNLDRGWETVYSETLGSTQEESSGCSGGGRCDDCVCSLETVVETVEVEEKLEEPQEEKTVEVDEKEVETEKVEDMVSVTEAAKILGCSEVTIYYKVKKGYLDKTPGRGGKIPRSQIEALRK